jgi:hypothetical protein
MFHLPSTEIQQLKKAMKRVPMAQHIVAVVVVAQVAKA